MDTSQFFTHSMRDLRVARILAAALDAVDPDAAVERYLTSNPLPSASRTFALGLGKAAIPMTRALSRFTDLTGTLVITKHASTLNLQPATLIESGHPVPDARSLAAGEAALEFVSALSEDDLLICLISGGGSALMTAPTVPLDDMQTLTSALLACGARIDEINTLRRHLDRVKGGGLVQATKARLLSLILSDVVGNPLEAIASGPTAPDLTTKDDAISIIQKYELPVPSSIYHALLSNPEAPKPDDPIFFRVHNVIVGDNALAAKAALDQARKEGFHTEYLGSDWQGEAREVGVKLVQKLRVTTKSQSNPFCLIAGGETTVTLNKLSLPERSEMQSKDGRQNRSVTVLGTGGRNQELALAAVPELAGLENVLLLSLATDGEDGPTDAAGAVVSGETLQRAEEMGLVVADFLSRNDAYHFFERLGDLLKIGPSGTNVNDLVFLLSLPNT